MNNKQRNLADIIRNEEFVLIDTNFIGFKGIIEGERYRANEPLMELFVSGLRKEALEQFSIEDLERFKEYYNFWYHLIKEQQICTVSGVVRELEVRIDTYSYVLQDLKNEEKRRRTGKKRNENLEKLEVIMRIKKEIKRLTKTLRERKLPEDDLRYQLLKKYATGLNKEEDKAEADESLVAMAFYQVIFNNKDVSVFSNDVGVKNLIGKMQRMLSLKDFSYLFNGWQEKRRISLYDFLTEGWLYKKYKDWEVPFKLI